MSRKSAGRLVAALSDAPRTWGMMFTATYRERVMDGRDDLAKFFRKLTHPVFDGVHWAWVREYQGRGAVHYHVLWDETIFRPIDGAATHTIKTLRKGGKKRLVVRGELERLIVEAWMDAVGDTSKEFARFQWGGTVQPWIGANGCARYFASYMTKESQKELPEDAECSGRWWFVCQEAKAVPVGSGFLVAYNQPIPLGVIFDKESLIDSVVPTLPIFIPKWGDKPQFKWR